MLLIVFCFAEIEKSFRDNYPQTLCKINKAGIKAFETYINDLQEYLNAGKHGNKKSTGGKG